MPVDRDKVLQAAQKLVEKKRYDKAVAEYQKLVVEDPKDVRTLLKIGDLYLKMEQYADAITTYERVGQHYSTQGFLLKAIAVFKQIRDIVHKHVPHLEERFGHIVPKLAETYQQLGLTNEALATYDEVATRYQRAGRDRDAIDVFRKIVEVDPSNPLPYLRLAEAYVRIKEVDEAIACFGTAAELLLKMSRRDDALKVVERLLQHRADPKFARIAAEIYLERGEPNDPMTALSKLQVSFKDDPKDLETLAILARAFDKLGQPAKSIEVQKEAARIAKDAGKIDHFNALVEALVSRAPDDEGVRHLVALRSSPGSLRAPPGSLRAPPGSLRAPPTTESIEVSLDDEAASSAAPFALRQSIPAAAPDTSDGDQDAAVRSRRILAQVEALCVAKEYDQAVALLFETIEELPASHELREKLCDVLIDAGDQAEAVRQLLAFARWRASNDDLEGATRILDEILLLEPGQHDALVMLRELGYAVPTEEAAAPPGERAVLAPSTYDPNAPLPAYELDDVGLSDAPSPSLRTFPGIGLDDPFSMLGDAPLPSFPMDDDRAHAGQRDSTEIAHPYPAPTPAPVSRRGEGGNALDEDALEEVEFFVSQGMFDEARGLLLEQLQRLPNHPLLLERLRELEEHAAAAQGGGSGTRAMPRSGPPVGPSAFPPGDQSFDIASSLDALDALDAGPPAGDAAQVSVESAFEQFKASVATQISESDAATHYDLGGMYKELGNYAGAVQEFELAARDPGRECVCHSNVGMIHRELGDLDAAIDAFRRALHAQVKEPAQELALTYEIGDCYEASRAPDQALYFFQRVVRADPLYNDPRGSAVERVRRLDPSPQARPQPRPQQAMAVGAETVDEFDAALDDLLSGSDLP